MLYKSKVFFSMLLACVFSIASHSNASTIEIEFLDLDLVYDGSTLYDAASSSGGVGDPADADTLNAVSFEVDSTLAGPVITSDASIDISIPVTLPVPTSPGTSLALSSTGYFDLLLGSTAPATALGLTVDTVTVTFIDSGLAQFIFGAELTSDIDDQDLPYGLAIGTPVEVSFSANVVDGTLTDDGDYITGFEAFGTGEITGPLIPEPASVLLFITGLVSITMRRNRS